tara:strand:+ start:972 stop:1232 length:261 start_codon:yes stop_codon:yes gene_type:complete
MKLYLLNEYVGGTPFESRTLGVYLSLDEAKEHLKKELKTHDHENYCDIDNEDEEKIITETSFYFDCDDWWGGCEIQTIQTEFNLTK